NHITDDEIRRELRQPLLDCSLFGVESAKRGLQRLTIVLEEPAKVRGSCVEPALDIRYHPRGRAPAVGCVHTLTDDGVRALDGDKSTASAGCIRCDRVELRIIPGRVADIGREALSGSAETRTRKP